MVAIGSKRTKGKPPILALLRQSSLNENMSTSLVEQFGQGIERRVDNLTYTTASPNPEVRAMVSRGIRMPAYPMEGSRISTLVFPPWQKWHLDNTRCDSPQPSQREQQASGG